MCIDVSLIERAPNFLASPVQTAIDGFSRPPGVRSSLLSRNSRLFSNLFRCFARLLPRLFRLSARVLVLTRRAGSEGDRAKD
jgi:hypothetical protein